MQKIITLNTDKKNGLYDIKTSRKSEVRSLKQDLSKDFGLRTSDFGLPT